MTSLVRNALAVLSLTLISACTSTTSPPQDLKLRDDGILMPTFRADFGLGRGRSANGTKTAPFGLTFEATRAAGEPNPISEYSLLSMQVLGRFRFLNEPQVRTKLLFGFEFTDLDAEQRAGTLAYNRSRESFGPAIGLDVGITITGQLEAYGRGTFAAMTLASTSARGELGLRANLGRHTNIFAGYRWWDFEQEDLNWLFRSDRNLEIRTEGVVIGMGVHF